MNNKIKPAFRGFGAFEDNSARNKIKPNFKLILAATLISCLSLPIGGGGQ